MHSVLLVLFLTFIICRISIPRLYFSCIAPHPIYIYTHTRYSRVPNRKQIPPKEINWYSFQFPQFNNSIKGPLISLWLDDTV